MNFEEGVDIRVERPDQKQAIDDLLTGHRNLVGKDPEYWANMQATLIESDMGRADIPDEGTKNVAEAVEIVLEENKDKISKEACDYLQGVIDRALSK